MGLDGWKCDGTDAVLFEWGGFADSYSGIISEVKPCHLIANYISEGLCKLILFRFL
jgi:hypothetical protein